MKVFVHGIGVLGPGIDNWQSCQRLFNEQYPYDNSVTPDPMPSTLPANELRRSSDVVRWSLQVAQEAMQHSQLDAKTMATVFASSGGEVGILHKRLPRIKVQMTKPKTAPLQPYFRIQLLVVLPKAGLGIRSAPPGRWPWC